MTVLVTGANRGIGREMVRQMNASGQGVIATTRSDIPEDTADNIDWHKLDVTSQASFDALNTALGGKKISLLVCNAGVLLDRSTNLKDGYDPDTWAGTFAANAMGPFLTIQNLLDRLENAKIAIIASKMGSNAHAKGGEYAYRASKAAVINLATNLSVDLAPKGISVGVYHPGWVRTDMGSTSADISPEDSAAGLIARFAELSLTTTGCFLNYDGESLPY